MKRRRELTVEVYKRRALKLNANKSKVTVLGGEEGSVCVNLVWIRGSWPYCGIKILGSLW